MSDLHGADGVVVASVAARPGVGPFTDDTTERRVRPRLLVDAEDNHDNKAIVSAESSAAPACADSIMQELPTDTAIKIYATGVSPSYLMPWQVLQQRKWTGTGFVLQDRRIVTNAHVVHNATVLQIQKQNSPKKFRARVVCVAHDVDLALVTAIDESFWQDILPATFADGLPELYSEVKAVGFPQGGSTVCVTKGVVSRIDAHLYAHPTRCGIVWDSLNSPGNVIVLQIDAAINPGNSGGPTFDSKGKLVGVASSSISNAQNIGYIIPVSVLTLFLDEIKQTGRWSGISELGLSLRTLESDSLRQYLKMPSNTTGVLVDRVAPLGTLCGAIERGDVITQIDGHTVSNEGKVPIEVRGRKVFIPGDALVTTKAKGATTRFEILRDGETMELTAVATPIPPLMPRFHACDSLPEYLMVGGLVFTRLTVPLKHEYSEAVNAGTYGSVIFRSPTWDAGVKAYKKSPEHEVVILLRVLEHDINIGCPSHVRVLESVNNKEARSLSVVARIVAEALRGDERFVHFKLKHDGEEAESSVPDIVLERARIRSADDEICTRNHIRAFASESLLPFFEET